MRLRKLTAEEFHEPLPRKIRRPRFGGNGRGERWLPAEDDRLIALLDEGTSYDRIAWLLRRSGTSVRLRAKRLRHRLTRTPATMSAREVARLLGVRCSKTVTDWIARGWLPARNGGELDRPLWRVPREAVEAFVDNPDYWMAWAPERVTDPELRRWAIQIRAGQPRWLTPGEVAQRYQVARKVVTDWVGRGELPTTRYGNHWIHEEDLIDWRPPYARPRGTPPRDRTRCTVDGCPRPYYRRWRCRECYAHWHQHGRDRTDLRVRRKDRRHV